MPKHERGEGLCVQFFNSRDIPGGKHETEVCMENFILLHESLSPAYLYSITTTFSEVEDWSRNWKAYYHLNMLSEVVTEGTNRIMRLFRLQVDNCILREMVL